jgi:hypothetical protein
VCDTGATVESECSDPQPLDGDSPWTTAVYLEQRRDSIELCVCAAETCERTRLTLGDPIELTIGVEPWSLDCPGGGCAPLEACDLVP